jgi:hypothetical protein
LVVGVVVGVVGVDGVLFFLFFGMIVVVPCRYKIMHGMSAHRKASKTFASEVTDVRGCKHANPIGGDGGRTELKIGLYHALISEKSFYSFPSLPICY